MTDAQPVVDHGIPAPRRWSSKVKYPWQDLKKPDDSFVWPGTLETARSACFKRWLRHGERYRAAKVTEEGKHLIRVWREA